MRSSTDKIKELIAIAHETKLSLEEGNISQDDAKSIYKTIRKELKDLNINKPIDTFIEALFS
jgi:hypothetical protein